MHKIKVRPLKGANSLQAFNIVNRLLLGLKMLPDYAHIDYEEFYEQFGEFGEERQETLIRQAVGFIRLEKDELEAIVSLVDDKNGIPLSAMNLKNLSLDELFETVVAVAMEIGKIKVSLVSEKEKKNYPSSQSTLEGSS